MVSTFEQVSQEISHLILNGSFVQAEQKIDKLAQIDSDELDKMWGFQPGGGVHCLSIFYNQIGFNYRELVGKAIDQNDEDRLITIIQNAERCHRKAMDLYEISAEDMKSYPDNSPFNDNFISTLAGLGITKFWLRKFDESRAFLLACTGIQAKNERVARLQSEAALMLGSMSD